MKLINKVLNATGNWEISESGIWKSKDNVFYRLGKDKQLYTSEDLRDWRQKQEGYWQDADSKWIRLIDKNLFGSINLQNWSPVSENYWQSPAGVLYTFDNDLNLYSKTSNKLSSIIGVQN